MAAPSALLCLKKDRYRHPEGIIPAQERRKSFITVMIAVSSFPFTSGIDILSRDGSNFWENPRMINDIINASKSDSQLVTLVDEAREYAQIYLLAKQRHKGCDGTGEVMTLREEFKDTVDKMIRYCREKKHLSGACDYDPDVVADALLKDLP
jgi:hypothetical protein